MRKRIVFMDNVKFLFPIIFIVFLLISPICPAQQNSAGAFTNGLNVKFDASEMKKFLRAQELVNQADKMLQEAKQQYQELTDLEVKQRMSSGYDIALKKLFESSETCKEANNLAFSVLKQKCDAFWQQMSRGNHHASGMDKARYYENASQNNLKQSLLRRQQVLQSDRFDYSLEAMNDAIELEKTAIRDEGRALQICSDFPVEYDYNWEDDPSLEEIVKLMKDPIVHEPPEDVFATVDVKASVDSSLLKEIIFKVQIAAHTAPITGEYLNLLYRGNTTVDMIYEEDWYKYSIGRYKTYEEAEEARIACEVKKAFVVAYQEGKKMSLQEAIQTMEKRKASSL
jgi:hypothetical protein